MKKRMYLPLAIGCAALALFGCGTGGSKAPADSGAVAGDSAGAAAGDAAGGAGDAAGNTAGGAGRAAGEAGNTGAAAGDAAAGAGASASGQGGVIKVGVLWSATGDTGGRGVFQKEAMEMAAKEINEAGGILGKQLELVFEDDGSDQTTSINMMNKMVANDEIVAVFGPHTSTNAMAVSDIVEQAGIPYFTGGTSVKLKDLDNAYMFKVRCNDGLVVESAMNFATGELGAKKIGILYINDEFGVGGRDIMVKYCQDNGLEYVEANHNGTDQDLTSQIMQMKQENVDVLIGWSSNVCPILARQTTELGFDKPVIMNAAFAGQDVLDSLPAESTDGKYAATDFTAEDPDPEVKSFVDKFKEAYGKVPVGDRDAAYYGGLYMFKAAVEKAQTTDREAVKEAMYQVQDIEAPFGKLKADDNGCLVHQCDIVQAQKQDDGKCVLVLVDKVREEGF